MMMLGAIPAKGLPGAMAAPSPGEISIDPGFSILFCCDEGGIHSARALCDGNCIYGINNLRSLEVSKMKVSSCDFLGT